MSAHSSFKDTIVVVIRFRDCFFPEEGGGAKTYSDKTGKNIRDLISGNEPRVPYKLVLIQFINLTIKIILQK